MKIYGYIGHVPNLAFNHDFNHQYYGILEFACNYQLGGKVQFIMESDLEQVGDKTQTLENLMSRTEPNDVLIVYDLRVLGCQMLHVVDITRALVHKGVKIYSVKGDELGLDIELKIVAYAKSVVDELVRNAAESRLVETKDRQRAADSVALGRPKGSIGVSRLDGREEVIKGMVADGMSKAEIARRMSVSRPALIDFCKSRKLLQDR